jgi:putative transcriptional regulator
MDAVPTLANQLLIALPALDDPNFSRSVTLVCQHDADGAMGVMVNRA